MSDTPTPQNDSDINVSALEEELNKAINSSSAAFPVVEKISEPETTLHGKIEKLEHMEEVIEKKSHVLEADVKTKLASLKGLKRDIEEELQKIKSFESTKDKIEEQIEKIKKLENDQFEIETEIKSIEESTRQLGI